MTIEFRKIPYNNSPCIIENEGVVFNGCFKKLSHKFVGLEGTLFGSMPLICDKCGKKFDFTINEVINLKICDGFCKNEEDLDIIESFDSVIDFDEIIKSEMEAIRSDYHYCQDCASE